jgi:phosphoribosylamine-glycine ligase
MVLSGTEIKNKAYYGELMEYSKLTSGVQKTTDAIAPLMKQFQYKGFFSTEVRTTKDNKNYLIDMTCRLPLPPSPLYPLMFDNLGEIVWGLANGELVEIKPKAKCGLYLSIASTNYQADYQTVYFPEKYRENIKLVNAMKVDDEYCTLNINGFPEPEVGCIAVAGNSFEECKKMAEEIAEEIKGFGIQVDISQIDKAKEEFDKMIKGK